MKLETERLDLLPLQAHNLALSVVNYGEMATDLGLRVTNIILDDEMKYAMKIRLRKVIEDSENYLWLTNWAVVLKVIIMIPIHSLLNLGALKLAKKSIVLTEVLIAVVGTLVFLTSMLTSKG